ncbi:MAG: hypothetical protein ACE5EF_09230 [Dehalococcoidia bacterium]
MIARGLLPRNQIRAGYAGPLAAVVVLGAAIAIWAIIDLRPAGDGSAPTLSREVDLESVAYVREGPATDTVFVQEATAGAVAQPVALFNAPFGLHARGSTAPDGSLALIIRADVNTGRALLSILDLRTLAVSHLEAAADYLTSVAWKSRAPTVALTVSGPPSEAGLVTASIVEVNLETGESRPLVEFESVFEVEPVGYDGDTLYAVAIDQSGSMLYRIVDGTPEGVAQLSVGRTRDWVLDPAAARLAYLDVIGAGAGRAAIARVLFISTAEITAIPGDDDHVGLVWRPGAEMPDVGGPGGSLTLEGTADAAVIVPFAWDPGGHRLLASVTELSGEGSTGLEVLSGNSRVRLADGEVNPLGWVLDGG